MKIEKAKQLTSKKFKRMTGVSRQTFELMVGLVKADTQKKKKPVRRPKLIIEDQVLMVIQYWGEYRTYYHKISCGCGRKKRRTAIYQNPY